MWKITTRSCIGDSLLRRRGSLGEFALPRRRPLTRGAFNPEVGRRLRRSRCTWKITTRSCIRDPLLGVAAHSDPPPRFALRRTRSSPYLVLDHPRAAHATRGRATSMSRETAHPHLPALNDEFLFLLGRQFYGQGWKPLSYCLHVVLLEGLLQFLAGVPQGGLFAFLSSPLRRLTGIEGTRLDTGLASFRFRSHLRLLFSARVLTPSRRRCKPPRNLLPPARHHCSAGIAAKPVPGARGRG